MLETACQDRTPDSVKLAARCRRDKVKPDALFPVIVSARFGRPAFKAVAFRWGFTKHDGSRYEELHVYHTVYGGKIAIMKTGGSGITILPQK